MLDGAEGDVLGCQPASPGGSMSVSVDRSAPVVVSTSLHVDAPIERVWGLLADVAEWRSWNTVVKSITVDGPIEVGTAFRWKSGPGTIRSQLLEVEAPTAIAWTGNTMGIKAIHVYQLTPTASGVDVSTEESWDGLPPRLFGGLLRKALDKALRDGLVALKASAEAAP
jgi:uncharacterized protein YndB with AHSA1/START domain